jgi:hypothetical protein
MYMIKTIVFIIYIYIYIYILFKITFFLKKVILGSYIIVNKITANIKKSTIILFENKGKIEWYLMK